MHQCRDTRPCSGPHYWRIKPPLILGQVRNGLTDRIQQEISSSLKVTSLHPIFYSLLQLPPLDKIIKGCCLGCKLFSSCSSLCGSCNYATETLILLQKLCSCFSEAVILMQNVEFLLQKLQYCCRSCNPATQ